MSILLKKKDIKIPLEVIFKDTVFILLEVLPMYKYDENNHRTKEVTGYSYTVIDTVDFERIRVKIPGQINPLITNEELQEHRQKSEEPVTIEFVNGALKPYMNWRTKSLEDSFSAADVVFVK